MEDSLCNVEKCKFGSLTALITQMGIVIFISMNADVKIVASSEMSSLAFVVE